MILFGGKVIYPNEGLEGIILQGWNRNYYSLTFDDFGHSLVVLFACVVVNNWQFISWGFATVVGLWAHLYFGFFFLTTGLAIMSIALAFILDAYMLLKKGILKDPNQDEQFSQVIENIEKRINENESQYTNFLFSVSKNSFFVVKSGGFYEAVQLFH